MQKKRERQPKQYEVVNIHPEYKSEDERDEAMKEAAAKLYYIYKHHGLLDKKNVQAV